MYEGTYLSMLVYICEWICLSITINKRVCTYMCVDCMSVCMHLKNICSARNRIYVKIPSECFLSLVLAQKCTFCSTCASVANLWFRSASKCNLKKNIAGITFDVVHLKSSDWWLILFPFILVVYLFMIFFILHVETFIKYTQ